MRDLRGMMETLRRNEPDNELPHSPWQISSLEEVLDRRLAELTDNGFRASAYVDADLAALPESVRETLGKVVTEATANMVKHGDRDAPCSIMIETGDGELEAVFINTPRPTPPAAWAGEDHPPRARRRARARRALGGECDVDTSPTWVLRGGSPSEPWPGPPALPTAPIRVIVVDDDHRALRPRQLRRGLLHDRGGRRLRQRPGGPRRRHRRPVDVVVMDIRMPVMDGIALPRSGRSGRTRACCCSPRSTKTTT